MFYSVPILCPIFLTVSFSFTVQLLQMFYKQQDEIRRLREQLSQRDIQIRQLELEIKNVRNSAAPY